MEREMGIFVGCFGGLDLRFSGYSDGDRCGFGMEEDGGWGVVGRK